MLKLTWTAPNPPEGKIVDYQVTVNPGNKVLNTNGPSTTIEILDLTPFTEYSVSVSTKNEGIDKYGEASTATFHTLPSRKFCGYFFLNKTLF